MLKKLSNTRRSSDAVNDDSVWDLKCWSAIALFGLLLSITNTHRFLQQAGKSVALLAGGAAIATLIHRSERYAETDRLIADLQVEQTAQAAERAAMETAQQQVIGELYEIAIAEATLFDNTSQSSAASQAEIEQAQARIAELEAALDKKTAMATEMLTELEAEATSTFNQFSAKIAAQDTLIESLRQQIESLRDRNSAIAAQQTNELFASIGSDPLQSQQRLSQLLKN